jgi:hypothetical protein
LIGTAPARASSCAAVVRQPETAYLTSERQPPGRLGPVSRHGGGSVVNPIVEFVTRIFQWIGRAIGMAIAWLCWPFMLAGRWYTRRGWIVRIVIGLCVLVLIGLYANFFWQTQRWTGFDPDYARKYDLKDRQASAGEETPAAQAAGAGQKVCARSAIVDASADLTDFNVNKNQWISSMILYKLGFFGLDWDRTPFFDNKASFQRGINQAVRRTSVELVDTLGRVRGTSQVDADLQDARGALQFDEYTWYLGWNPPGPKTPTPSYYRTATSAILKDRAENHNNGWFDTRADDRFWFAYGQLYGYYGILTAAEADFDDVIKEKKLTTLWDDMEGQLRAALRIQPFIIANGREDSWIVPSHLTTLGFYILRVRSNLVDIKAVLQQ